LFSAALLIIVIAGPRVHAQGVEAEKKAAIAQLITMMGVMDLGQQMSEVTVSQMTDSIRAVRPDLPPEVFDALAESVNEVIDEHLGEFETLVVPIYDRHFSLADLQGLITFYQTPLGQKLIQTLPAVTQESTVAGQQWGASLGPEIEARVLERLQQEGVNLGPPRQ
jgi:hypothetical protein